MTELPRVPPKHLKGGCYARADALELHLEAAKAEVNDLQARVDRAIYCLERNWPAAARDALGAGTGRAHAEVAASINAAIDSMT